MIEPSTFYGVLVPATIVAGFIRGFAGFGGPLFLLPIVNLFLSPATSVGLVVWIDVFANLHLLPHARRDSSAAVVLPMTVGTVVAMPLGAYLLINADPAVMKRLIGAVILMAALILMTGWRYRGAIGRRMYGVVGAVSGAIMGATSIAAMTALFLSGGQHTARENRANFIVWVFFATLLLLTILAISGTLGVADAVAIAILAPGYILGSVLGSRVVDRVSETVVRRAVLLLIMVVAVASMMF